MIKVLFFLTHLGGGGAEMHFVRLSHELRAHGIEPVFATTRGGGSYESLLPADVDHHVLETGSLSSGTVRLVRSVRPLARLIDEIRPDILCPVLSLTTLPAIIAAKRARHRPKIVLSIQNALSAQLATTKRPLRDIQERLTRNLWREADGVVALSQGVADELAAYFPFLRDRMEVVYNIGMPIASEMEKAKAAEIPPAPEGRKVAVACGRLTQQKDYPTMFRALAAIPPEERPFLRILGKGELEDDLKTLANELGLADDIEFLGFRKDVLAFMGKADMFVLSSAWEGFGNVIVEAMAMGTPVIATRCPHGPDEIITDGVDGMLVPVAQPQALAEAWRGLLADDAKRAAIGEKARSRAQDFAVDRIAREYAAAFKRFAGAQR